MQLQVAKFQGVLEGLYEKTSGNISETFAEAVGLSFLFILVAIAVYIFIVSGKLGEKYEWLEGERFETAYGVSGLVKEKLKAYQNTHTQGLAGGVVLCVVSSLPLIILGCIDVEEYIYMMFTGLLLVLIAIGVYLIVRVSMVYESYKMLLQEGEYKNSEKLDKEGNRKLKLISGSYWCVMTAVYLGWSFWTMKWDMTWIVWPVAGVLFAAVSGISKACLRKNK